MTEREVAQLRIEIHVSDRSKKGISPVSLSCRMLAQLLDERESLLEALKNVTIARASMAEIRAAIAKAEQP